MPSSQLKMPSVGSMASSSTNCAAFDCQQRVAVRRRALRRGSAGACMPAAGPLGDRLRVLPHAVTCQLRAALVRGLGEQQPRRQALGAEVGDLAARVVAVDELEVLLASRGCSAASSGVEERVELGADVRAVGGCRPTDGELRVVVVGVGEHPVEGDAEARPLRSGTSRGSPAHRPSTEPVYACVAHRLEERPPASARPAGCRCLRRRRSSRAVPSLPCSARRRPTVVSSGPVKMPTAPVESGERSP